MLDAECDLRDMRDEQGVPALFLAMGWDADPSLGYAFIEPWGALDMRTPDGSSILHYAARRREMDMLMYLLWLGGDLDAPNAAGLSARDVLKENNAYFVERDGASFADTPIGFLLETDPDTWATRGSTRIDDHCLSLCGAVTGESNRGIWPMILNGAPVDALDGRGLSAMHRAASRGNTGAIRMLAAAGHDLNLKEANLGFTPLHAAVAEAQESAILTLLDLGADAGIGSTSGGLASELAESVPELTGTKAFSRLKEAASGVAGHAGQQAEMKLEKVIWSLERTLSPDVFWGRRPVFVTLHGGASGRSRSKLVARIDLVGCRATLTIANRKDGIPSDVQYIDFDFADLKTPSFLDNGDRSATVLLSGRQADPFTDEDGQTGPYAEIDLTGMLEPIQKVADRFETLITSCRN